MLRHNFIASSYDLVWRQAEILRKTAQDAGAALHGVVSLHAFGSPVRHIESIQTICRFFDLYLCISKKAAYVMKHPLGRRLPALTNLIALMAVARTGNVTRAAEELFLTQSAVSRQIKDLEEFIGHSLFLRDKGEISLTPDGRRYVDRISPLVNQLEEATLSLSASVADSAHLTVSSQATFAVKWLLPRLAAFGRMHPGIIVNVETHLGQPDLKRNQADLLVVFTEEPDTGWTVDYLMRGGGYPVCAPSLLEKFPARGVEALATIPLLHQRSTPNAWPKYFSVIGLAEARVKPGPTYALLTMGLQAALAGIGAAILPDFVVHEDLLAGRLVRIHDVPLLKSASYHLLIDQGRRGSEAIENLRAWMLEQAAQSEADYNSFTPMRECD